MYRSEFDELFSKMIKEALEETIETSIRHNIVKLTDFEKSGLISYTSGYLCGKVGEDLFQRNMLNIK